MVTARSVPEWIGASPDEDVPQRVRVRVWKKADGYCQSCTRKIAAGERWVADHVVALINGGENRERNLQLLCDWCDRKVKTPADVAEKARAYRKQSKHLGLRKSSHPIPGSRSTPFRKHMDGTVSRRTP